MSSFVSLNFTPDMVAKAGIGGLTLEVQAANVTRER